MTGSSRVALVTGAGRGIGEAVAKTLAAEGALVAVTDRDAGAAEGVAARLRERGGEALGLALDVTAAESIEAALERIERDLGPIHTLVNVAGVLRIGDVADCRDEDWDDVLTVNATGVFRVSRAVVRRMVPRGAGCIVTVGSNAAGVPRVGLAAYSASKAAAAMFTKSLGLEVAAHGIRCNVVAPGSTDTMMLRGLWSDERGAEAVIAGDPEAYWTAIPLGRIADPTDVADAVAFLASDRARHITMQELFVDGGAALRA